MVGGQFGAEAQIIIPLPGKCNTNKNCYIGLACEGRVHHYHCNKDEMNRFFLEGSSIPSQAHMKIP